MSAVPDAILIVADREHIEELTARCEALGGGWLEGPAILRRNAAVKFVVLFAHDTERIRNSTPLLYIGWDENGLRAAIISACSKITGLMASKLFIGAEARAIVDPVILAATVTRARA